MDSIDQAILTVLHQDSRTSLKVLGERVGLSSPSVSERLRRLEERGVVRAFTVDIEPRALGYQLQAIVRIKPLPGQLAAVEKLIQETPEFCECDKVTGDDCFVARVYVRSIEQLDGVLDRIADKAQTSTAIVKAQTIRRRPPPWSPGV
ncbi:Lrp/AsnC family transcriptional regulator [Acidovorax sp. sif1233]|jgi:Lrp/AsnC family transcriptional regulator, leucine-responsive regulatory protein|uniref:Lrp/AsnC family transcriptional regulator n=1 Tax=Acidovorax TaxID=12916 RepID=UPI0002377069|nr:MULTISPECIES: Lrp/AsnC family transcriptional regulator [Acidovorax]KRD18392.1 AsnC family transcriptional regulator [Acidovorax sp. Root267]KRD55652.1 AsnC family transcriptional regulator [Acidovorax sp. Root275]MBV7454905.1 Lrp/AsnC family transcriptional regulator [Acidovorax sp. sif1233]